jgi:hypothetical protein
MLSILSFRNKATFPNRNKERNKVDFFLHFPLSISIPTHFHGLADIKKKKKKKTSKLGKKVSKSLFLFPHPNEEHDDRFK